MRRALVIGVTLLPALAGPAALAENINGTPGRDTLFGTAGRDVIRGLGGDDELPSPS